ncbi:bis(5'-nucleosyl)-tetraphosphatase [Escherichia coli]|uniref:Bis(5'-nucleosyl)-tetraphosphatase n=1 Tax=Escherichia coli TaxID=562 RepID=A0A2X3JQW2_ECOLX|nr:bis(5'-nucleosyl)-tetraphosphatase [Escherichia coli]
MATYLIGDVHGCYDELIALLHKVEFTPGKDTLWLTGDLVARGPGSLDVLRYVKSLGDSVRLVLGNHDLHLLAVFAGISRNKPKDRLTPLLGSAGCRRSCLTGCVASLCCKSTKRKSW